MKKSLFVILLCMYCLLQSCTYEFCHTYQKHHWKRTREVALKNKRGNYKRGYSIYGRGYGR